MSSWLECMISYIVKPLDVWLRFFNSFISNRSEPFLVWAVWHVQSRLNAGLGRRSYMNHYGLSSQPSNGVCTNCLSWSNIYPWYVENVWIMCNVSGLHTCLGKRDAELEGEGSFTNATKWKLKCNVNLRANTGHLIQVMSYIETCHPCFAPGIYGDGRSPIKSNFIALSSTSLMS